MEQHSRRELLKLLSLTAMASVTGLPRISLANSAEPIAAQPELMIPPLFDDYKALVCLQLLGGNDSWNLFVPTGDETGQVELGRGYQSYASRRGDLAVSNTPLDLPPNKISSLDENPYRMESNEKSYLKGFYPVDAGRWGINGLSPEMAKLWHQQRMALVVNTGVLKRPVTRDELIPDNLPAFLFAHNHQQRALATASADRSERFGWAGRLADLWQVGLPQGVNKQNMLGMNISFERNSLTLQGERSQPLTLKAGRATTLTGMSRLDKKIDASRRQLFDSLSSSGSAASYQRLLNQQQNLALSLSTMLSEEWDNTPDFSHLLGSYGEELFSLPDAEQLGLSGTMPNSLIKQLETVVRLIDIGRRLGLKRQTFVVTLGGFDTHAGQADKHPLLLRNLSLSLWKFQQAIDEMNLSDKVVLFSQSDFGRTLQTNGDGTDHAWGSQQFVMGGPVKAGVYGQMPDLRVDSSDNYTDKRGRFIPTLAVEQTTAALLKWYGVSDEMIPLLLPSLSKFATDGHLNSAILPII